MLRASSLSVANRVVARTTTTAHRSTTSCNRGSAVLMYGSTGSSVANSKTFVSFNNVKCSLHNQLRFKSSSNPSPNLRSNNSSSSTNTSTNTSGRSTINIDRSNTTKQSANSPWKRLNVPQSKAQKKAKAQTQPRVQPQRNENKLSRFQKQHRKNDNSNASNNKFDGVDRPKRYPRLQSKKNNDNRGGSPPVAAVSTAAGAGTRTQENKPNHPIEKLRESFMQSLQSDRERRQNLHNNISNSNSNNNSSNSSRATNNENGSNRPKDVFPTSVLSSLSPSSKSALSTANRVDDYVNGTKNSATNSESKLDQLLRMSRQTSRNDADNAGSTSSLPNGIHNRFNNASGAKAFRERRKLQQRQQQQQQQQQQQGFQNRNQRHRNNSDYHHQKQQRYDERMKLNKLQQELLNTTNVNQQEEENNDLKINDGGERAVVLPRKDLTIVELSTILRVDVKKIINTIKNELGESIPKSVLSIKNSSASSDESMDDLYKVDVDMAELIALELGLDPQRAKRSSCLLNDAERRVLRKNEEGEQSADVNVVEQEEFPSRPPVVCIMGHVDHGKTTLMDSLRQRALEANGAGNKKKGKKKKKGGGKKKKGASDENVVRKVAGTEAGGITQTVSAFQVALPTSIDGTNSDQSSSTSASTPVDKVTFLDTPGHAAFKAMRQSGSNGADVIVLVIAADDGVSPQTVEIIDMYKSIAKAQPGSISLVVALTKIDKPGIDVDESIMRIENQLLEYDIYSENMTNSVEAEFGGVQLVPVSGLTGEGLDDLIESLALQSEIMDLRADAEARAEGLIIDAKVEKGLGVVADCIVRWGKLELGDYVVSGTHGGKVRILNDVNNRAIKKANPSQPVRIVGLQTLPKAGDPIVCVQSEELAKEIISRREALNAKESHRAESSDTPLDVEIVGGASKKGFMARNVLNRYGLGDRIVDEGNDNDKEKAQGTDDKTIRIPIILKADADGTLAALRDTVLAIQDESKLDLCIDPISISIGHVTPSDVRMAADSEASIFCFNLKGSKDKVAMGLAAEENVEIRSHDVIYHLLDEAKDVFSTYCPPTPLEKIHGKATVKAVFDINNNKDAERVAGLMVQEGSFYLDKSSEESGSLACKYRVHRGGEIITPEGVTAKSLRKVKEEVSSVRRGEECGLNLKDFLDIQEGDVIECYSVEMKRMFV